MAALRQRFLVPPAGQVLLTGRMPLGEPVQPNVVNSSIAAWSIGKAVLRVVQVDNDGQPMGLAAHTISALSFTSGGQNRALFNLDSQDPDLLDQDFIVRLL